MTKKNYTCNTHCTLSHSIYLQCMQHYCGLYGVTQKLHQLRQHPVVPAQCALVDNTRKVTSSFRLCVSKK